MDDDLERRVHDLESWRASEETSKAALQARYDQDVVSRFSTLNSPLWKRVLFRIDGWGPWHTVRDHPRWRPWRRWYTS